MYTIKIASRIVQLTILKGETFFTSVVVPINALISKRSLNKTMVRLLIMMAVEKTADLNSTAH
jgi:hypothetical protein